MKIPLRNAGEVPDPDMKCYLCETRRPRRFCPGVRADICSQCCGEEREVTIGCPFDCEYLREAREHEKPAEVKVEELPNRDIEVSERFVADNDHTLRLAAGLLLDAASAVPGAVDYDIREALETLIRTYRTLESGLIYETRPANPLAAMIHQHFQARLAEARERLARSAGVTTLRDSSVLGVLVFLQRVEYQYNNGRRRGRSFLNFLHDHFRRTMPEGTLPASGPAGSPLIIS